MRGRRRKGMSFDRNFDKWSLAGRQRERRGREMKMPILARLVAAGAMLAACAGTAPAQAPKPWKHGIIAPKADAGFLLMAAKRGFVEREGLKLELLEVKDDQIGLKALLAGEQRFEPDLVVFHFEQFELEALAFHKAALGRHQQEAGIGLGRDDPVFPWFRRLRRRGAGASGKHRARRYQSRQNGHFHLPASSLSLSARQRPFIKIPVKAHALAPAVPDCERSAPPLALRTTMEPP